MLGRGEWKGGVCVGLLHVCVTLSEYIVHAFLVMHLPSNGTCVVFLGKNE